MSKENPQNFRPSGLFVVIQRTGGHGPCKIIPEGDPYPAIYTKVYGPASIGKCEAWVAENCTEREPTA